MWDSSHLSRILVNIYGYLGWAFFLSKPTDSGPRRHRAYPLSEGARGRPLKANMQRKLVCPINFGMVEENLYRSGQPSEINFPFLSTLGLKTIIWLAAEEPQETFLAWADENDITIRHMGIQEGRDIWDPMLTEDCVVDALNVIVRVDEIGPLAIMCNLGRHRTGTVVGCLRRLQGWNLARYGRTGLPPS